MFNLIYSILFYNFYMKKEITCTVSIADEEMSEEEKKLMSCAIFCFNCKMESKREVGKRI